MKTKLLIPVLAVYFLCTSVFAADTNRLTKIFTDTFWTIYQENYCGRNIENFSIEAINQNVDLKNAYIMEIRNGGFDTFGMVGALAAREEGRLIEPASTRPPFRTIGYSNWNFHVVLMSDGLVYDYDFMNKATVLKLENYLNEMYIPLKNRNDPKWKKDKLGPYKISLYPIKDYLQAVRSRTSTTDVAYVYDKYLRDYIPNYFK